MLLKLRSVLLLLFINVNDHYCHVSMTEEGHIAPALQDVLTSINSLNCTQNLCNTDDPNHPCKCDRLCVKRRDCCQDFWKTTDSEDVLDIIDQLSYLQKTKCETVTTYWKYIRQSASFIMISTCPENLPKKHAYAQSMCESKEINEKPYIQIPVQSHTTNLTYKNIFCAMCHDDVSDTFFWNSSIGCYPNTALDIREAMKQYNNKCGLQVRPPPEAVPCKRTSFENQVILKCDIQRSTFKNVNKSNIIRLLCATTNAKVKVNGNKYQSIYCAVCNVGPSILRQEVQCLDVHRERHHCINCLPSGIPFPNKSFALLFDANFQSKGNILGTQTLCPIGYQFSSYLKQCQKISCSNAYHLVDGKCKRDMADPITSDNSTMIENIQMANASLTRSMCSNYNIEVEANNTFINENGSLLLLDTQEYERESYGYNNNTFDICKNTSQITEMTNASLMWLLCPKISRKVEMNKTFINENGSLFLLDSQEEFEHGMYEYDNHTLVICVNTNQNFVAKFPGMYFELVSIIGNVVSLLALSLKMLTFFLLPEARSLPDRIVFCLSVSLFLAQLLFTCAATSVLIYSLCATVGVLMHYCFLATFFWMNVLAIDVWSTFANTEAPFKNKKLQQCKFLKYSLYAWLVPFCIVSVGSIFDWTHIQLSKFSPLRPYYGQVLCWISSRPALILYFLVPVGLLLATNLVLFSITTGNICNRSRKTLVAQKAMQKHFPQMKCKFPIKTKAHHLNVCLYFKLGVILGLTWIIGFIAAYADQPAFWYLFIILNSIQGVYILLAFTPYRKVKQCAHQFLGKSCMGSRNDNQTYSQRSSTRSSQLTRSISTGSTQRTLVLSPSIG